MSPSYSETAQGRAHKPLAQIFDPRHNSLNFVRLALALAVVCSHAITLGGYGNEKFVGHLAISEISVDAFFGISGFLITRSALTNSLGRFFWQRFLRIYPGYWVCLAVTAFAIVPIAWVHDHATLVSLWHAHVGPVHYILSNIPIFGHWGMNTIGDTPRGVPLSGIWNGPLWTLRFELECYIGIAAAGALGLLRRRPWFTAFVGLVFTLKLGLIIWPQAVHLDFHDDAFLRLVPIFGSGSLVALWPERVPDSPWLALVAFALSLLGATFIDPHLVTGPAVTYVSIWLGVHLPARALALRNDISYGIYIYGWPIQILLAVYGIHLYGYPVYLLCTLVLIFPLGLASWFSVEKTALALKKWTPSWRLDAHTAGE